MKKAIKKSEDLLNKKMPPYGFIHGMGNIETYHFWRYTEELKRVDAVCKILGRPFPTNIKDIENVKSRAKEFRYRCFEEMENKQGRPIRWKVGPEGLQLLATVMYRTHPETENVSKRKVYIDLENNNIFEGLEDKDSIKAQYYRSTKSPLAEMLKKIMNDFGIDKFSQFCSHLIYLEDGKTLKEANDENSLARA